VVAERGAMKAALVALCAAATSAVAQPATTRSRDPAAILRAADAEGQAGDWTRAGALVATLDLAHLDAGDLAEARRLRGLAAFFAGELPRADQELYAWLALDPDARLDPAVTPPEAISFFESVRARHAAELRARRRPRKIAALNLLPPWGQFQNGDSTKGWVIAGTGAALLAADVGSYALLRHWCSADLTCDANGDRSSSARTWRTVNLVAGGALVAVYVYGVVDGFWNYRAARHELVVVPTGDGAQVLFSGSF
jgi:hypothetical protein